jgi:hypothetical protein
MAKTRSTKKKLPRISEAFAAKMLEGIRSLPPYLTMKQIGEAERVFKSFDVTRRIGYLTLTKSGDDLIDSLAADRDVALGMAEWLDNFRLFLEQLDSVKETLKHAQARIVIAIANREDSSSVLVETKLKRRALQPEGLSTALH